MTINISTKCYTPIKGLMARLILLDSCGALVTGASSAQIVFKGYTKITPTAQYENGARQFVRLADGTVCVNEKDPDALTNFEVAADLCLIDPGLVANFISPARLLTATESPTGTGFAMAEGASVTHFSLEVWQKVAGNLNCGTTKYYAYNAWPHLTDGKLGGGYSADITPSSLSLAANSLPVNPNWNAGASWLGAGAVSSAVPDHWFQNITTVAPPSALCGIQQYP